MRLIAIAALGALAAAPAFAQEPDSCATVRFSDVGWTDITATTAVAGTVLRGLGYEVDVSVLSVPVTYTGLAEGDIDVFLGNWMPTMEADIAPYRDAGTVDIVRVNLEGAKYTLAASKSLADQGLTDFSKIAEFAEALDSKIYGIEPGNDGNRLIQDMIDADQFGLGEFELVESSEQGMLAQAARAERQGEGIVFLGWEPHPMNANLEMIYLTGGDDVFGPNFGGATVLDQHPGGLRRGMPQRRQAAAEPRVQPRDGERDHGRDPRRRGRSGRGGGGVAHREPGALEPWLAGVTDAGRRRRAGRRSGARLGL